VSLGEQSRGVPPPRAGGGPSAPNTIDYYVWLLSDWAYLGGLRFNQLAERHRLQINHVPMRMPDVFAGSGGILLADRAWQWQAYRIQELRRWRAKLGIVVNIEPRFFPTDVDLASCVVIAAQRRRLSVADLVNAIMRAVWAEDRNIADLATVTDIVTAQGFDAASLVAEAGTVPVRDEYRANTQRALEAGVFGSPFYGFNGELFWGQDRLDMLEEAIIRAGPQDLGRTLATTRSH
jgi:2-hydroxychromene-2-carboxylate isomerase